MPSGVLTFSRPFAILSFYRKHQHEWFSTFNNIKNGNRCPRCSASKGEKSIANILDKLSVKYIPQYFIKECRDKAVLPFDFYLPNYNLLIEYQGEQHYMPVDFANKGTAWAEDKFKHIKKRDKIKKEYAYNNNINFLEISYQDYKNINEILFKELDIEECGENG